MSCEYNVHSTKYLDMGGMDIFTNTIIYIHIHAENNTLNVHEYNNMENAFGPIQKMKMKHSLNGKIYKNCCCC